jgi:hypothetical protein
MAVDLDAITVTAEVRETTHGLDDKITSINDTQEVVCDGATNVEEGIEARVTGGTPVIPN